MGKSKTGQKIVYIYANWETLETPQLTGSLFVTLSRGKEIFSFEYDPKWLKSNYAHDLDPNLKFFGGPQYPKSDHANFGLFLDSSPDRWGLINGGPNQSRTGDLSMPWTYNPNFTMGPFFILPIVTPQTTNNGFNIDSCSGNIRYNYRP